MQPMHEAGRAAAVNTTIEPAGGVVSLTCSQLAQAPAALAVGVLEGVCLIHDHLAPLPLAQEGTVSTAYTRMYRQTRQVPSCTACPLEATALACLPLHNFMQLTHAHTSAQHTASRMQHSYSLAAATGPAQRPASRTTCSHAQPRRQTQNPPVAGTHALKQGVGCEHDIKGALA